MFLVIARRWNKVESTKQSLEMYIMYIDCSDMRLLSRMVGTMTKEHRLLFRIVETMTIYE